MTTYTAKRNALERAINDLLCNCGVKKSCATCEHCQMCAMARRTKVIINEDKRNDCNNDFAAWADNYIKELFGNDNP